MKLANGQVTVNDEPTKNRLYRFCEKKIDQWLQQHLAANANDSAEFRVSFIEDSRAHQVSCETEVNVQGTIWRGCDLGGDSQQAFMHSLKRLQHH